MVKNVMEVCHPFLFPFHVFAVKSGLCHIGVCAADDIAMFFILFPFPPSCQSCGNCFWSSYGILLTDCHWRKVGLWLLCLGIRFVVELKHLMLLGLVDVLNVVMWFVSFGVFCFSSKLKWLCPVCWTIWLWVGLGSLWISYWFLVIPSSLLNQYVLWQSHLSI